MNYTELADFIAEEVDATRFEGSPQQWRDRFGEAAAILRTLAEVEPEARRMIAQNRDRGSAMAALLARIFSEVDHE